MTTKRGSRGRRPPQPRVKAVSFRLDAPEATSVSLVGDFNNWDPNATPLEKGVEGAWQATLRLLPGAYQYKFVVNGIEWREDPANPNKAPNPYGTQNSLCEVA